MKFSSFLQMYPLAASLMGLEASISESSRLLQSDNDIMIEDLSPDAPGMLYWRVINDPVMGGQSKSQIKYIEGDDGKILQWAGEVNNVPSFNAPGFIKLEGLGDFHDVSSCEAIKLIVKSTTTDYKGFRLEFVTTRHNPETEIEYISGYKALFFLENTPDFQTVIVPFHDFTVEWDPLRGDPIDTCEKNPDYCSDIDTLAYMTEFSIMGEGYDGEVDLELKSISATMCEEEKTWEYVSPPQQDTPSSPSSQTLPEPDENDVMIEDFSPGKLFWRTVNDPVMGGKSKSDMHYLESTDGTLFQWEGQVNVVAFLNGPGFVKLEGSGDIPDVSSCQAIKLILKSTKTDYKGYRLEFGTRHDPAAKFERIGGYKAHFFLEDTEELQMVVIPFHDFTVDWDPYTGDPIKTCEQIPDYCPDTDTLVSMEKIALMGEGSAGEIDLEIKSISATMCGEAYATSSSFTPASSTGEPSSQTSKGRTSSFGGYVMFACALFVVGGAAYYKKRRNQMKAYQAISGSATNTVEGAVYYELELS